MSEMIPMVDANQIITGVATELTKNAAVFLWEKVKKFFQDMDADELIRYGEAYEEYLLNTRRKHSQIKTLIYRKVPKSLESFYECTFVKCADKQIDTSNAANLLNLGNKIVVTGTGGIGKSMLLKYLFLNTIKLTDHIPILLELRSFNSIDNEKFEIFSYIYSILVDNGFDLKEEYFEKSMQEGGYVILFDGFDELNRKKADLVGSEIKRLTDHYNKNHFIISSRPMDEFIGWNDFCEVSVCPLTKEQAKNLINKIEYEESVKEKFLVALDENLYEKYESFASNPLLLTIMLMTFSNHASIPERLNDFYEQAFATLYNMHDATKDCYTRDIRTGLGCEEFKTIFSYICFKTYFKNEHEFSEPQIRDYIQQAKDKFSNIKFTVDDYEEDLILSVCMLVKDGLTYRFAHRSFQEYFAAWYTCKLMDSEQKKVLSAWLEQSNSVYTDEYMKMLFDMQPDKVNRLILCPGIKKIKDEYDKKGFTIDFLRTIVDEVMIRTRKKNFYDFGFHIQNHYLGSIINISCTLNHFVSIRNSEEMLRRTTKVVQSLQKDPKRFPTLSFEKLLSVVSEEELLEMVGWFRYRLEFLFEILERYSDDPTKNKRKLSAIVDEL